MTQDFINKILTRKGASPAHLMRFYNHWPHEWFAPNDAQDEYTTALQLHEFGLLEKMRTPLWKDGSFTGFKVMFKKL